MSDTNAHQDDPPKSSAGNRTLKDWLMEASPTEYILAAAAIASCVVAFLQYQVTKADIENSSKKTLEAAAAKTNAAAVETETFVREQLDEKQVAAGTDDDSETTGEGAPKPTIGFVVQLASYQRENCDRAQRAADRYSPGFSVNAQLYLSPSGQYVVVGLPASSAADGNQLVVTAQKLSTTSKFEDEDFSNARLRENPEWKKLSSCEDIG